EEGVASDDRDQADPAPTISEPLLPLGIAPLPEPEPPPPPDPDQWVEPLPPPPEGGALSSLFDRLANDADLYTPLTVADEDFVVPPIDESIVASEPSEPDMIASVIEYADDPEDGAPTAPEPPASPLDSAPSLWRITGRGF